MALKIEISITYLLYDIFYDFIDVWTLTRTFKV